MAHNPGGAPEALVSLWRFESVERYIRNRCGVSGVPLCALSFTHSTVIAIYVLLCVSIRRGCAKLCVDSPLALWHCGALPVPRPPSGALSCVVRRACVVQPFWNRTFCRHRCYHLSPAFSCRLLSGCRARRMGRLPGVRCYFRSPSELLLRALAGEIGIDHRRSFRRQLGFVASLGRVLRPISVARWKSAACSS